MSQTNPLPEFLILQEIRDPGTGDTSETIKNSEGFQISPACELISLPVSWILAEDTRPMSQKQRTLLVGAQQTWYVSCSCQFSLSPKSTQCPRGTLHLQGVCNTAEKPKLRNPIFYCGLHCTETCMTFALAVIFIITDSKQTCFLPWREIVYLDLPSSAKQFALQIRIFEEMVWNKSHQHLSSQEVQKRERSLENYFPTDIAPVPSWRAGTRNQIITGISSSQGRGSGPDTE